MNHLAHLLTESRPLFNPIIPKEWQASKAKHINFDNPFWQSLNKKSRRGESCWPDILQMQAKENTDLFVGGYNTLRRNMYGENKDLLHLGIDLVLPINTPVFSPFSAQVHKIMSCPKPYDYGTAVILRHDIHSVTFYTLFAHLSQSVCVKPGDLIKTGAPIGCVGAETENGGWPPHIHFQILSSNLVNKHFFQGVTEAHLAHALLPHCPDPNLILQMEITS